MLEGDGRSGRFRACLDRCLSAEFDASRGLSAERLDLVRALCECRIFQTSNLYIGIPLCS
jgi:hypothetical protein